MAGLIFDEKTLLDGNLFKYEQRLHSHLNKYVQGGAILTTYFSQEDNAITVDRGTKSIDELFGHKSPLRFAMILDFPLYNFSGTNPENDEETPNVEDIRVEGDAIIIPCTVVPKQYDFFIVNHLKMKAVFEVVSVTYDSMKSDGYYKIHYRLHSTSDETIQNMRNQCIKTYHTDLNAVGGEVNPIITEVDYVKKTQVIKTVNHMINLYRSMFYNSRHNCFLFHDQQSGLDWFDMCGNEFIARHSVMNPSNSTTVIILNDKIQDPQLSVHYANSVYSWIETGCPIGYLQKFPFILNYSEGYLYSSFNMWGEGDIQIMQPITTSQDKINWQRHYFFDETQFAALNDSEHEANANEYERLIWKYIHKHDTINLQDISLDIANPLITGAKYSLDTFLLTPICIYIIRQILRMN